MPLQRLLSPRALPGLLIALLGVGLLLNNLGYVDIGGLRRFWPMLLVALGAQLAVNRNSRVLGGAAMVLGGALQLSELGWIDLRFDDLTRLWPLVLIAVGVNLVARQGGRDNMVGGGLLTAVGAYFLASNFGLISFSLWQLWPVAVIVVGFSMIYKALGR